MLKNVCIFVILILIFLSPLLFGANGHITILSICEELSGELTKGYVQKGIRVVQNPNLRLAMGVVIEASTKKRSTISAEFESNLEVLLWYGEHFSVIERSELKPILKERGFQMTDLVDQDTVKRLGKVKAVDALMIGNYTVEPAALTFRCKIVAVETGDLLSTAMKRVPFKQLHPERSQQLKQEAETPLPKEQQNELNRDPFCLDFWYETLDELGRPIRQPIGSKVKTGEQVNIMAQTDVDAYVYAFTIDADYETFPVFATVKGEPIRLKADDPRRIEGIVEGTTGTERFYAIAQTDEFKLAEIEPIIEKEVEYLKSQEGKKAWRPLKTRNLLLPDESARLRNRFVQANFWFEHVQR